MSEDSTIDASLPGRPEGPAGRPVPSWMSVRKLRPYVISFTVHLLIAVAMGSWVLPMLTRGTDTVAIEAVLGSTVDSAMTEFSQQMVLDAAASNVPTVSTVSSAVAAPTMPQNVSTSTAPAIPAPVRVRHSAESPLRNLADEALLQDLNLGVRAMAMHDHRGTTRVEEARNAVGIASTLEGDLLSIAEDGDAMVVWLLDQSLSMQQDIRILAEGLLDTLEQIEADKTTKMQHAVVAFGDDVTLFQRPTVKGHQVATAIYKLPADPSGVERTFASVEWCVDRLFPRRVRGKERQNLLILWTDESGDDYLRLENTIAMCLQSNVRVDVIGPSAVLGAETGYTAFRHPADGLTYYLPVNRGPDSAFPQKLSLGYWYRGVPGSHDESFRGPFQGTSPRWHGGSNLQSMLSGFSPYALTRLSRETGGRYLMYDRPGDRAPFTLDQIRDYQPDYYSAAEIQFRLQRQPLRQIVLASSGMTWSGGNLAQTQPDMTFGPGFGGQTHNEYVRSRLVPMLSREIRQAWADAIRVERALQPFLLASAMPGYEPDQQISRRRRRAGKTTPRQEGEPPDDEADSSDSDANAAADSDSDSDEGEGEGEGFAMAEDKDADPAVTDARKPNRNSAAELKKIKALESDEVQMDQLATELNESLLEQLYHQEESPRWRAWTDLNMGRLLAMSVRLREYLVVATGTLNNIQDLNPDTNSISFAQTRVIQGGAASEARLNLARRLLQRCIDQNRGTAWQVMAERELRDSFGLRVTQRYVPRPKNVPRGPAPPPKRRPELPNL